MAAAAEPLPNISEVDLVMGKIFQFLNERDLDNCVRAFEYWQRDINIEKRHRQDVYPLLWTSWSQEHGRIHGRRVERDTLRSIENDIHMKVRNYSSRRCVPLLFCNDRVVEDAEILFPGIQPTVITEEYLSSFTSVGSVAMSAIGQDRITNKLRKLIIKAMRANFPYAPLIILSTETELIGCGEDLNVRYLSSMSHAITGYIIPQYPGFEIHNFEIPAHNDFSLIPDDANIKGLLVISDLSYTFNRVMHLVHSRRLYEIAIGGSRSVAPNVARNGSIIAFCGENVETASLVVSPWGDISERKLRLFRETILFLNKCFAFVFHPFKVKKTLTKILTETFTRLYPNVPLIGVTTPDIYGVDYLPGVSDEVKTLYLSKLLKEDVSSYDYEDKSVFVLVSIKP